MRIFIYKFILWVIVTLVTLGIAKTTWSGQHVECDLMPTIEYFVNCEVYNTWGYGETGAFKAIITRESGWNSEAQNPKSTAYGLMQFLSSTWKIVDCEKTSDAYEQVRCGIKYVEKVYSTPSKALAHHHKFNWY